MMKLADSIGSMTSDGTWVLLRGYKYVRLDGDPDERKDTDKDGLTDKAELGELKTVSVEQLLLKKLESMGISEEFLKADGTVTYYDYLSDPTLPDTDYDGVDDGIDPKPRDGSFSFVYKNKYDKKAVNGSLTSKLSYSWLFGSNESYNRDLGELSLLYAGSIYNGVSIDGRSGQLGNQDITSMKAKDLMRTLGMSDVIDVSLKNKNDGYNKRYTDQHLTEVALGHRKVTYKNDTKEIVQIVVRGTNGTLEEWESNFDVGTTDNFSSFSEWKKSSNHMGFDITANRVRSIVDQYLARNVSSGTERVFWITGHSRGAAIANILGAYLIDSGETVFDYTYATPKTTLASDAGSYKGIYNLINEDDFVPCLPMWGFKHYGKTAKLDMTKSYEKEWEAFTGFWDYDPDTFGLPETIEELEKVASTRNALYETSNKFSYEEKLRKPTEKDAKEELQKFRELFLKM
ncbi:MAG: lipase family protein [Lachnospiraceae bacterium]|nr:lipase family protein [Lachnospiraceae bacterium]